jgi:hypothetical protein
MAENLDVKKHTVFTNCLVAAWEAKCVYSKLVAHGAAQFERDVILSKGTEVEAMCELTA